MKKPVSGMSLDEATARGLVPGIKLSWWRRLWNRFLLWYHPKQVPEVKWHTWTDVPGMPAPAVYDRDLDRIDPVTGAKINFVGPFAAAHEEINRVLNQSADEACHYWQNHMDYERPDPPPSPPPPEDAPVMTQEDIGRELKRCAQPLDDLLPEPPSPSQ